jgi:hypothetical protein
MLKFSVFAAFVWVMFQSLLWIVSDFSGIFPECVFWLKSSRKGLQKLE